jgi:uncharacterized protein (TIGR00288 family)
MSQIEEETLEEKRLIERITERILNSSYIQSLRSRISGEKRIAIFVDGPNFLRKIGDRSVKLDEIEEKIEGLGDVFLKKVLLNEHAGENLIKAITNSGYEPVVTPHNIYIALSIEVMKAINLSKKPDLILLASRHAKITPILQKIKDKGIETAVMGFEPGFSIAVKKTSDGVYVLE